MRRAWFAPAVLAVAIVLQLAVLDGLHLPRGGVPDLVLVLVVALAMANGPVSGMVTGFVAGLCLDIAPPGTGAVGQYALVCCLAGWAAGSLGRLTRRSPLRALAVAAIVIIVAEAMAAALALMLVPTQVTVGEIREFLPVTIGYDLLISPFALYLVILAATTKASRGLAGRLLAGTGLAGTGLLTVPGGPRPIAHQRRAREPRLNPAAARAGDGWVGVGPASHPGLMRLGRSRRLHPAGGVPGSASGYAQQSRLPVRPVNLRLSSGRRGDGVTVPVPSQYQQPGQHPGALARGGRHLRFTGESGGSAARQYVVPRPRPSEVRINFRAHARDGLGPAGGASWLSTPVRDGSAGLRWRMSGNKSALAPSAGVGLLRSVPRLRMTGSRSALAPSAGVGLLRPVPRLRMTGSRSALAPSGRVGLLRPVPRLRMRDSQSALAPPARAGLAKSVPTMHFSTPHAPIARRPAAAPKFRRGPSLLNTPARAAGLEARGVLGQSAYRAGRSPLGSPRLGLAGGRRGLGMLGGSGQSTLRRPPARVRKQPQFGYGRRSPLTFLAGRRLGGRWLARRRAGRRSGAWLIGKRTGESR